MSNYTSTLLSSISEINGELSKISQAIATKADKDVSNTMEGDLDMNSNDILNATSLNTDALFIGGQQITPSLVATTDIAGPFVSINDYGNTEGGFAAAVTALSGTHTTLILDQDEPLVLSGNTQYTIKNMTIQGQGSHQLGDYNKGGCIHIEGTTTNVIQVDEGSQIIGVTFYYPNQVTTATPTVYPATISFRNIDANNKATSINILRNRFINSYIAIDTNGVSESIAPEVVRIESNEGCAINTFIDHPHATTETIISFNKISYVWWRESVGQPIRDYISQNGIGVHLGNVDGTIFANNFVYGLGIGLKFSSDSAITNLVSSGFDGCRKCIDISDASQVGGLNIAGCNFLAKDPNDSSYTSCVGLYGSMSQNISGQITMSGCRFDGTNGNHIDIEQTSGNCFLRINIAGTSFFNAGLNDETGAHYSVRVVDPSHSCKVRVQGDIESSVDTVVAGNFVIGRTYRILTVGTTDYTLIGAASNTVGLDFTATGVGTGTGAAFQHNAYQGVHISGCEMADVEIMAENLEYGIRIVGTSAISRYRVGGMFKTVINEITSSGALTGQIKYGSIYSDDLPSLQNNVASDGSGGTLPLPNNSEEFFVVTGTTGITDIDGKREGRRVTLKTNGSVTFTDGGNLSLAGNFVSTGADTITLVCDGSTWYEVSRSVN